jgi:hypothetical protein
MFLWGILSSLTLQKGFLLGQLGHKHKSGFQDPESKLQETGVSEQMCMLPSFRWAIWRDISYISLKIPNYIQ